MLVYNLSGRGVTVKGDRSWVRILLGAFPRSVTMRGLMAITRRVPQYARCASAQRGLIHHSCLERNQDLVPKEI